LVHFVPRHVLRGEWTISILRELQERKVIRVAGVYIVASWLLLQIAATVGPILGLPDWFEKLVLALLGIGLPIALILAWAFELTPDGVRRGSSSSSSHVSRYVDYGVFGVVLLVAVYVATGRFAETPPAERPRLDRSVAVLPFQNMSSDEANEPFTAGIHSDLLAQLSRILW